MFGVEVEIKDPLTTSIDVKKVITSLFQNIPKHLLINIKSIKVGQFSFLEKRKLQAMYKNSTIYSTNVNNSESDLLDNLIHETAHSVEDIYESEIYSDKKIETEFLKKRELLYNKLRQKGYSVKLEKMLKKEYDPELDEFLYSKVGYRTLSAITPNLFYSPYGCTSIREYFANGFEAFYMNSEISRLKKVSPSLFFKLTKISNPDIINKKGIK